MAWTDEQDALLRQCFAEHMSSSEAAAAINGKFRTGYSRNAIIGRAMRKKIQSANPPRGIVRSPKPRTRKGEATAIGIVERTERRRSTPMQPQFACDAITGLRVADVVPLHLTLLEVVEIDGCRWPYGDSPFTFCGCPKFGDSSYCEPHDALATKLYREDDRRHVERPLFAAALRRGKATTADALRREYGNEDAA